MNFTILMNANAIIGVKYFQGLPSEASFLEVFYGGDSGSIKIYEEDATYSYYYKHFLGQKNKMLTEAEENNEEEPTEPIGPVN